MVTDTKNCVYHCVHALCDGLYSSPNKSDPELFFFVFYLSIDEIYQLYKKYIFRMEDKVIDNYKTEDHSSYSLNGSEGIQLSEPKEEKKVEEPIEEKEVHKEE